MLYPNPHQISVENQKTHQLIDQSEQSHFFYEKQSFRSIGHLSPTSTCPSDETVTLWESQHEQRSVINENHEENLRTVEFGIIEGNVVALSIQKYTSCVSEYLKHSLLMKTEQIVDFISLDEFKSLDIQKQQYEELLDNYYKSQKSTPQNDNILKGQNSVFKAFLEEITYLNHQEINFEIIWILLQMYTFKNGDIKDKKITHQFLHQLASSENLTYINLKFLDNENTQTNNQTHFLNFLEKLFKIFEELYIHYTILQLNTDDEDTGPSMLKGGLKLFSSKRDIWDSDDEDECLCLNIPSKRIKYV